MLKFFESWMQARAQRIISDPVIKFYINEYGRDGEALYYQDREKVKGAAK